MRNKKRNDNPLIDDNNFHAKEETLEKEAKPSTLEMIKKFKEEIKLKDSIQKMKEYEL